MFEFLVGIGVGIWIGTNYNCRPYMEFLAQTLHKSVNINSANPNTQNTNINKTNINNDKLN
jgi:hypothetical protein